jgi:hypothetical protein
MKNILDISAPSVDDSNPNVTRVTSVATPGVNTGVNAPQMQGNVANDAVDVGSPVKIGGKASNTPPADVALGDRVDAWFLQNGAQATYDAYSRNKNIDSMTVYAKEVTYTYVTADAVVSAIPVGYCGYAVEASSTLIFSVYDNASAASGRALPLSKTAAANDMIQSDPIAMINGIYVDVVSGTGGIWIMTREKVSQ